MSTRLIVNADDFGMSSAINRAIVLAHRHGIVTSASLMANRPQFEQAVRLAAANRTLDIGCHVELIDGTPLLPAATVGSLVEARGGPGPRFRKGLLGFAACALTTRIRAEEVYAETLAQIQKVLRAGIAVSHVDTHRHTHALPHILRPLLRAAKACGVAAIRNPFEPFRVIGMPTLLSRPRLMARWVAVRAACVLASKFKECVARERMITTDGTLGISATGGLDCATLEAMLSALPPGTWELVCHPGCADPELRSTDPLGHSRTTELATLCSHRFRRQEHSPGIELVSYRELAGSQPAPHAAASSAVGWPRSEPGFQ